MNDIAITAHELDISFRVIVDRTGEIIKVVESPRSRNLGADDITNSSISR